MFQGHKLKVFSFFFQAHFFFNSYTFFLHALKKEKKTMLPGIHVQSLVPYPSGLISLLPVADGGIPHPAACFNLLTLRGR